MRKAMRGSEAAEEGREGASLCSTKRLGEGEEAERKGRGKVVKETRRRSESAEPMAKGSRHRRSTAEGAMGFIAGDGRQSSLLRFNCSVYV
jgi:hypothetical protein